MSVAPLSANELGTFAAIVTKLEILTLPESIKLCEIITAGNVAAWAATYSDRIEPVNADDIEREALAALVCPPLMLQSFGPLAYNMVSNHGEYFETVYGGPIANYAKAYDQIASLEKQATRWQETTGQAIANDLEDQRLAEDRGGHIADNPDLMTQEQAEAKGLKLCGSKLAAKNIRITLKKHFPGVKFSVRTDYDSVTVGWSDGPSGDQVKPYVDRHSSGTFDGYTDCQGWDKSNAFGQVFGECRYTWINRDVTNENEAIDAVARDHMSDRGQAGAKLSDPVHDHNYMHDWRSAASQIIRAYEIPAGHKIVGCEATDKESGCATDFGGFYRPIFAKIAPDENQAIEAKKAGPYWTAKGYLSTNPDFDWIRRFRKDTTAQKAADKLIASGHDCEILFSRSRRGDYVIKRKAVEPKPAAIADTEIDAIAWL